MDDLGVPLFLETPICSIFSTIFSLAVRGFFRSRPWIFTLGTSDWRTTFPARGSGGPGGTAGKDGRDGDMVN